CVFAMNAFYNLKSKCVAWQRDIRWLRQDWGAVDGCPMEFFAEETHCKGRLANEIQVWNGLLAADVIAKFEGSCMASRHSIKSGTATIRFDEMVGYLAGDRWLNDAIMSYAIHAICSESPECYMLSSLVCDNKFPSPPDMSIGDAKFVILPINIRRIHWCLILVSLDVPNKIEAHFYDPMRGQSYREHVQGVWKDQLLPFLNRWHEHSFDGMPFQCPVFTHWVSTPRQPDGDSCGIMVLGVVFNYVRSLDFSFERDTVTKNYVSAMRLRLLWILLTRSRLHSLEAVHEVAARKTDQELRRVFGNGTKK
ncbi:hypothetical protein BBJ28_00025943, partial [Nothophytophthora sp. Chile5]